MRYVTSTLALGFMALSGCGGSSLGNINLDITDSPTDQASSVVVEFTGVRAQLAAGKEVAYQFPQPVQIDLAQLQVSATPGAKDSSVTLISGGTHGLVLTATGQTGLRINSGFDVEANNGSSFIIDFDARRSVLPPVGSSTDYRLQPVMRMLDERAAGNIIGSVPAAAAAAANCVPIWTPRPRPRANPSPRHRWPSRPASALTISLRPISRRVSTPWPSPVTRTRTIPPRRTP